MDRPEKMLIAVDANALGSIMAELAEIKSLLQRVTIQPATEWVTVAQAARVEETTEGTVRRWIRDGIIEARGAGKARRIKVGSLPSQR